MGGIIISDHTKSPSPTWRISSLMMVFLLIASLLPLIMVISEPVQASPAGNNFNVTWKLVRGGIVHKVYDIQIQNLSNDYADVNMISFFENTNFDVSELRNVEFYEWKDWVTVQVPIYENILHENVPIYDNENWELIVGYENRWWLEVVGYESKTKNNWKPCKMLLFKSTATTYKESYGFIRIPESGSKTKCDDFGDVTTEDGTKRFRLEFDVPITETPKGWGSSGRVALVIDNEEYHPEWSDGWAYKKKITIDCSKVEGENLDNFPALISWASDSDLAAHAQDDGDDIAFVDLAETRQLDHEIEFFDGDNGQFIAHVRVPNLYDNENVSFWMFYGNPDATNQENPTGVWDDNFVAVYHMDDYTTSTIEDSTSYNNDGTKFAENEPIEADGKIGKAQDFDGVDDYVKDDMPDCLKLQTLTFEAWIKPPTTTAYPQIVSTARNGYEFFIGGSDKGANARTLRVGKSWVGSVGSDGLISWDVLQYIAASCNDVSGTKTIKFYFGGVYDSSKTLVQTFSFGDVWNNLHLGAANDGTSFCNYFKGLIDEVRISNIIRSAGWIKTTFNNQSDPSTFYSVGGEQGTFPEKPELSKPVENQPYFEWSGLYADNYRLLVDDDIDFSSPCEDRVLVENCYQIPAENALENGIYYWKVVAQNAMGENASDVWSFSVGGCRGRTTH